jgi:Domain of unknown function (DUF4148)
VDILKNLISSSIVLALLGAATMPVSAQTQDGTGPTRSQTRAELAALESVGYYPAYSHGPDYPLNLQEAERKVAAQHPADARDGAPTDGVSTVGAR